jgi:hypothetical protein
VCGLTVTYVAGLSLKRPDVCSAMESRIFEASVWLVLPFKT